MAKNAIELPSNLPINPSSTLISNLNPFEGINTDLLTSEQNELVRSMESSNDFKELLKKFYREIGYDINKFQAAAPQIDYLFNLFNVVFKIGGWSIMNGTNSWQGLSNLFGFMQPAKLREDYENFLFTFEKTYGLQAYDQKTIENYLVDLNPELMIICEWYRPSLLEKEINKSIMHRFLITESIFVPKFINGILGVDLECFSKHALTESSQQFNHNGSVCVLSDLAGLPSFYIESPLANHNSLYSELSSKLPALLHWNGEVNLLRYSPIYPDISSPVLIILKNTYTLIGGPSYISVNGVYTFLEGHSECFGIHYQHIQTLNKKVQKDFGIDIFSNSWKPDEKYFLVNNIEFIYIKASPGDAVITKTDIVYWIVSDFCTMVHWFVLPKFRIGESSVSYKSTIDESHKFNLPLLCIEYLNIHMEETAPDVTSSMKKIISDSIDEQFWTGNFVIETFDYRSCSICGKDLVWRYARCGSCSLDKRVDSLCQKCAESHKCKNIDSFEKFTTQDLEKFYNRIEGRAKEEVQKSLCKVPVKPVEIGVGDVIKYDSEQVVPKYYFKNLIQDPKEKLLAKKPEQVEKTARKEWNLDEVYKRMGKKKQKIREAMENPLNGPRFNYELELKKEKEVFSIPNLAIPISYKPRENPFSVLIKDKKSTPLTKLISPSKKRSKILEDACKK